MPALMGTLTYARLFVEGELDEDYRERFLIALREHAMKPLGEADDVLERSGWCEIGAPHELELQADRVFRGGFINLGFRTDRWAIPAALLRADLRAAEAALRSRAEPRASTQRERKGGKRLSKRERQELKEQVLRQRRRQSPPVVRAFDLSWSLEERVVRFFSHVQAPILAMSELFTRTFGMTLVPEAPFTLATRLGLSADEEPLWDALEPTLIGSAEV